MLKWLISLSVVLLGFVIILLSLGYLLKENEAKTTILKRQLAQESSSQRSLVQAAAIKKNDLQSATEIIYVAKDKFGGTFPTKPFQAGTAPLEDIAGNSIVAHSTVEQLVSLEQVIAEHLNCERAQQCLLFNTWV